MVQSVWSIPGFPLAILCDLIISGSELVSTKMMVMMVVMIKNHNKIPHIYLEFVFMKRKFLLAWF